MMLPPLPAWAAATMPSIPDGLIVSQFVSTYSGDWPFRSLLVPFESFDPSTIEPMSDLIEPDLTDAEREWVDRQVASGRYESRIAPILALLRAGLEAPDLPP
jgi:hypothetical protein